MRNNIDFFHMLHFENGPLIQCITNEITCESMANALLYIGAKPIMADDQREFEQLFKQTDALLLNLGHLSVTRQKNLLAASTYAKKVGKPTVVDLVGYGVSDIRNEVGRLLVDDHPAVVKGNSSELRNFCQLPSHGRGVDGSILDQSQEAQEALIVALKKMTKKYPTTVFLATGSQDVVVQKDTTIVLGNGVAELDSFTGTGDIVGALIAALLGTENTAIEAVIAAVSYFNLCGEAAKNQSVGLADFRQQTLNQLSLLKENNLWPKEVKQWKR